MTTQLTWLGHSAFLVETADRRILIDPFFTDNPVASVSAADVAADFIIVTHGHGDHIGDTLEIAERTGAMVISNFEVNTWLQGKGLKSGHAMHIGGSHRFDFGTVKLTIAHHGSALPDNSYGGSPAGVLLKLADGNVYHSGDTGLFYDMKLIGEEELAVAILCIGDNFTMGPDDSVRATKLLDPRVVIPQHYATWPLIEQDPDAWAAKIKSETAARPVVLQPGQRFSL